MSFAIPNEGEVAMLTKIVADNLSADLFNADITPSESDIAADYTGNEPGGGTGYSAQTLTGGNWTVSTASGGSTTATYNSTVTFSFTSGTNTIYGFFILDSGSGDLMWAETFDGPVTVVGTGNISIEVILGLQ